MRDTQGRVGLQTASVNSTSHLAEMLQCAVAFPMKPLASSLTHQSGRHDGTCEQSDTSRRQSSESFMDALRDTQGRVGMQPASVNSTSHVAEMLQCAVAFPMKPLAHCQMSMLLLLLVLLSQSTFSYPLGRGLGSGQPTKTQCASSSSDLHSNWRHRTVK